MEDIKKLFSVENKVAVLTDGGGILAGEMAKGFLQASANVVLLDINETNLLKKIEFLSQFGKNVTGFTCDVLNEASTLLPTERVVLETEFIIRESSRV
jgi:hypothetical protein